MKMWDKEKAMNELGIDEDMFNEFLKGFYLDTEADLKKLGKAIKIDDFDEIAQIGHGIKGVAGNYRITSIADIANSIEQIAKERQDKQSLIKNHQDLKECLDDFKSLFLVKPLE